MSATYSHSEPPSNLENSVFAALRQLISAHPILSAIPVGEHTTAPYFVRVPSINLRTCVQFIPRQTPLPRDGERDEEYDALTTTQHNTDFKDDYGSKPFWRLLILHVSDSATTEFTASWVYHHAIADGSSGLVFHRHFLAPLQSGLSSLDINLDPIVKSPATPLLPPLEKLHPLPISFWFLFKTLWGMWFPSSRKGLWTGRPRDRTFTRLEIYTHANQVPRTVLSRHATARPVEPTKRDNTHGYFADPHCCFHLCHSA